MRILRFFNTDQWSTALYQATLGSAVNGNMDYAMYARNPPADVLSQIVIKQPYWHKLAVTALLGNRLWQNKVRRLYSLDTVPVPQITHMLNCRLPGIKLEHAPHYPCHQYYICPACLYRKLYSFYMYLITACAAGNDVYCGSVQLTSTQGEMPSDNMLTTLHSLLHTRYRRRDFQCTRGVLLIQPVYKRYDSVQDMLWSASAKFVMISTRAPRLSVVRNSILDKKPEFSLTTSMHKVGAANPKTLLDTLCTTYRYPAVLLYNEFLTEQFAQLYTAFNGNCRTRRYGKRTTAATYKFEKGIYLEDYNEQHNSGGPTPAATDVEHSTGDKRRQLRVVYPDHK